MPCSWLHPKFRSPVSRKKVQKAQKQTPPSEFGHQTGFTYRVNHTESNLRFLRLLRFFAAISSAAFKFMVSCLIMLCRGETEPR
jgi:hypothetical protein